MILESDMQELSAPMMHKTSSTVQPRRCVPCRCKHNQVYWSGKPYLAFGLGAASYIDWLRFSRPKSMAGYKQWVSDLALGTLKGEGYPIAARLKFAVLPRQDCWIQTYCVQNQWMWFARPSSISVSKNALDLLWAIFSSSFSNATSSLIISSWGWSWDHA